MPVRVEQRSDAVYSKKHADKQRRKLRSALLATLLAWPRHVSLTLRDGTGEYPSMRLAGHTVPGIHRPVTKSDGIPRTLSESLDRGHIRNLFVQSGLVSQNSIGKFIPIRITHHGIAIEGLISVQPASAKNVQFISVGIRPCELANGFGSFYATMNNVFDHSDFGTFDERNLKTAIPERKEKRIERWPMFYVRVRAPAGLDTTTIFALGDLEKTKTFNEILHALEVMAFEWLKANHFRPQALSRTRTADQHAENQRIRRDGSNVAITNEPQDWTPADAKNTETRSSNTGLRPVSHQVSRDDWSRIRSGRTDFVKSLLNNEARPDSRASNSATTAFDPRLSSGRPDVIHDIDLCEVELDRPVAINPHATSLRSYKWRDPLTGAALEIDSRTGMVVQRRGDRPRSMGGLQSISATSMLPLNTVSTLRSTTPRLSTSISDDNSSDSWFARFHQQWQNPRFAIQSEEPIPTSRTMGGVGQSYPPQLYSGSSRRSGVIAQEDRFGIHGLDLSNASVIGQVDQKFVLVLASSVSTSEKSEHHSLLLVDQHAASERCILEGLLTELCRSDYSASHGTSSTKRLSRPLHLQVTPHEHDLLSKHTEYFARWGIVYEFSPQRKDTSSVAPARGTFSVVVRSLPPAIASRCEAEPKLIDHLLRSQIHDSETPNSSVTNPSRSTDAEHESDNVNNEKHSWLRTIGSCPKALIDLVNSRACRSAIMFNDKLSSSECQKLVRELAGCAFPGKCAHGRPSMVPLISLRNGSPEPCKLYDGIENLSGFSGYSRDSDVAARESLVRCFCRWKGKRRAR